MLAACVAALALGVLSAFCAAQVTAALSADDHGRITTTHGGLTLHLTPQGRRDASLDENGYVVRHDAGMRYVNDVLSLPDGGKLVTGSGGLGRDRVVEVNASGEVRTVVVLEKGRTHRVFGTQLRALPDGKFLVAYTESHNCGRPRGTTSNAHFIRLRADLAPDETFGGGDGAAALHGYCEYPNNRYSASDFDFASDGSIVGAGEGLIYKLEPDGGVDPAFDDDFGALKAPASSVAVEPDGGVLAAALGDGGLEVRRFTAAGEPDGSYGGGDGVATISTGAAPSPDLGVQVLLEPEGLFVAGGSAPCPRRPYLLDLLSLAMCKTTLTLALLDSDGDPVEAFGEESGVTRVFAEDFLVDIGLTSVAGGIVADAGTAPQPEGAAFFGPAVLRFDRGGSLDESFAEGGVFLPQRFPRSCGRRSVMAFPQASVGTPENDDFFYQETELPTYIHGLGGDDIIDTEGAQRDWICGGTGDDLMTAAGKSFNPGPLGYRSPGPQSVFGQAGRDRISPGLGNDLLDGGRGADRLTGGRGEDDLRGGSGPDTLRARDGERDVVSCGRGRDTALVDRRDVVRGCEELR